PRGSRVRTLPRAVLARRQHMLIPVEARPGFGGVCWPHAAARSPRATPPGTLGGIRPVRKRLVLSAAAVASLATAMAFALWPRSDPVTRANCDRLRPGMTRQEVESILGPPGDYRTGRGETRWGGDVWMPDTEPIGPTRAGNNSKFLTVWVGDSAL